MKQLGIIGGGAMGSALLKGILNQGLMQPDDIYLAEVDQVKRTRFEEEYHIHGTSNPSGLTDICQTLILAVKPNIIPGVLDELAGKTGHQHLIISIAAGITLNALESKLQKARIVRVMPNTPAKIGKGVSAYALGSKTIAGDDEQVVELLGCIGKVIKVSEHSLDAVTAVSGSGPAYVFYFIEAMIDAAVMIGLSRADALVLVGETFLGSAELLRESAEDPAKLRNEVTSPGGTTAAALYELQQGACAGIIMKAVVAAAQKSKELGRAHG